METVSISAQERHSHVVYVSAGGAGEYQAVYCLKRVVRVVVLQHVGYPDPQSLQRLAAFVVHVAACCVRGAVRAVAADGKDRRTVKPCYDGRSRKSKLLIPSAFAVTRKVNYRLAARYEGQRPGAVRMALKGVCQGRTRFSCFAAQAVRKQYRLVSQFFRGSRCRSAKRPERGAERRTELQ